MLVCFPRTIWLAQEGRAHVEEEGCRVYLQEAARPRDAVTGELKVRLDWQYGGGEGEI